MPVDDETTVPTDIRTEMIRIRRRRKQRLHELKVAQAADKGEPPEELRDLVETQGSFHEGVKSAFQSVIGADQQPPEMHQHA